MPAKNSIGCMVTYLRVDKRPLWQYLLFNCFYGAYN